MSSDPHSFPTLDYRHPSRPTWKRTARWLVAWGVLVVVFELICFGPCLFIDESFGMTWHYFNSPLSYLYHFLPFGKWPSLIIITTINGLFWGGLLIAAVRASLNLARKLFGSNQ